jgi:hypothetical protein
MQNIRLDFISNIENDYLTRMAELRAMYIDLDLAIQELEDDENFEHESGAMRTISLARTHLETSLQYAIKSLCLIGEIKA